jgi:hypothetical protein
MADIDSLGLITLSNYHSFSKLKIYHWDTHKRFQVKKTWKSPHGACRKKTSWLTNSWPQKLISTQINALYFVENQKIIQCIFHLRYKTNICQAEEKRGVPVVKRKFAPIRVYLDVPNRDWGREKQVAWGVRMEILAINSATKSELAKQRDRTSNQISLLFRLYYSVIHCMAITCEEESVTGYRMNVRM